MTSVLSPSEHSTEADSLKRKNIISARTSFLKAKSKDLIKIAHEFGESGFKVKQGFVFKDGREFNRKDFEQLVSEYRNLLGSVCTIPRKAQNKTQDVLQVHQDVVNWLRGAFSRQRAVEEVVEIEEGQSEEEGVPVFQETSQTLVEALPLLFTSPHIVPRPLLLTVVHLYQKIVNNDNDPLFKKYAVYNEKNGKQSIVIMATINKLAKPVESSVRDSLKGRDEEYRREQEVVSMTNAFLGDQTPQTYHKEKKDVWAPYAECLVSSRKGREDEEGGEEEVVEDE